MQNNATDEILGLPLGAKFKATTIWNTVLEMERCLVGWKELYLFILIISKSCIYQWEVELF